MELLLVARVTFVLAIGFDGWQCPDIVRDQVVLSW